MVFATYLLRLQRVIGDDAVQRMKDDDLARCHAMGGFNAPLLGEE